MSCHFRCFRLENLEEKHEQQVIQCQPKQRLVYRGEGFAFHVWAMSLVYEILKLKLDYVYLGIKNYEVGN